MKLPDATYFSKDEKDKSQFEKFLKKTRSQKEPKKDDKKEESAAKKKDDEQSEPELDEPEPLEGKSKTEDQGSNRQKLNEFFMKPNGGGPRWENIGLLAFLAGATAYSSSLDYKPPSEEVQFNDFINLYLSQNQVESITIAEADQSSGLYQYLASIRLRDGSLKHLVLPQVETFNQRLEQA